MKDVETINIVNRFSWNSFSAAHWAGNCLWMQLGRAWSLEETHIAENNKAVVGGWALWRWGREVILKISNIWILSNKCISKHFSHYYLYWIKHLTDNSEYCVHCKNLDAWYLILRDLKFVCNSKLLSIYNKKSQQWL